MKKLHRISTVPESLNILLKGQLKFLSQYYDVTAISGESSDLQEVRTREKVNVHAIKMERSISPLKDLVSLYRLYRYFKKEKPEIIHSITPKAGLLSMVAGKLAGVPVRLHTFTGLVFPSKKGQMKNLLIVMDKLICTCATHIYPEGLGVKKDLEAHKITKKPLKVLGNGNVNGIDLEHFSPASVDPEYVSSLKKTLDIKEETIVFLIIGRLVKDKGVNELVSAFKNISQKSSLPIKLVLVGPLETLLDPLYPETLQEMEENPNIASVGFQRDVRPYLALANVFVLPSYREGFPNSLLQAGAMGLPAIVTDISGCNEIVTNNENGLIIDSKDTQQLQSAMETLLEDPLLRIRLAGNARKMVMKYVNTEVWDCLLNEYELIANQKRG